MDSYQKPFLLNALFSSVCAVAMLLATDVLVSFIGVVNSLVLQILALGLLMFALGLRWVAEDIQQRRRWALLCTLGDFLWVAATPLVLWLFWADFTSGGVALLVAIAVMVEALGCYQLWVSTKQQPGITAS